MITVMLQLPLVLGYITVTISGKVSVLLQSLSVVMLEYVALLVVMLQ